MRETDLQVLIHAIQRLLQDRPRVCIAIEGPSCAGKSTLGRLLAHRLEANLFHMDDFFLRPVQRTEERLGEVGGNVDRERFLEEVLNPIQAGESFSYRPYDCHSQGFLPAVKVTPKRLNIVEGSYSSHPALRSFYDFRILLTLSPGEQRARLEKRDPLQVTTFLERWIPLENAYLHTLDPEDFDLVLPG